MRTGLFIWSTVNGTTCSKVRKSVSRILTLFLLLGVVLTGVPKEAFASVIDPNIFLSPEALEPYIESGEVVPKGFQFPNPNQIAEDAVRSKEAAELIKLPIDSSTDIQEADSGDSMLMSEPSGEDAPSPDDISRVENNVSISKQSGAFTYSYPITVPPGRNGLTPDVSLQYSSQSGDYTSYIGYGWQVNIPTIERINLTGTENLYQTSNFTSSLDGELVAVDATSYKPKVETGSFNTYTYSGGKWSVFDKEGTKYTFGSSTSAQQNNAASSTQIAAWMLEEVQDQNGEKITYSYFEQSGQVYPDTIKYAFSSGTPLYTVEFLRASTTPHVRFNFAFDIETEYLIDTIRVYFGTTSVGMYDLGYEDANDSSISLLSSIQQFGYGESGATTTKPATTFNYQQNSGSVSWQNDTDWATTTPGDLYAYNYSNDRGYFQRVNILDMNGDALADWVYNGEVFMNEGDGWESSPSWTSLPAPDFHTKSRLADINGDSLPDIIQAEDYIYHPDWSTPNYEVLNVYLNQGDGTWESDPDWATTTPGHFYRQVLNAPGNGVSEYYLRAYLVDMNGDGLADWVQGGDVYMNEGDGWESSPSWTSLPATSFESEARLADINGDALPDIVYADRRTFDESWNPDDPIYYYYVYLNQGDGTWVNDTDLAETIPSPIYAIHQYDPGEVEEWFDERFYQVYLIDINGDGLADWVGGENSDRIYLNTGAGWEAGYFTSPVSAHNYDDSHRLVDVNGDLMPDIIRSESEYLNGNTTYFRETNLNQGVKSWLMASTTSEYGGEMEISYTPSTALQNSELNNPNSPYVLYTVTAVSTDPIIGTGTETTYEYAGGDLYYNPDDVFTRKYAGFETVTKTTDLGKEISYYHQGNGNSTSTYESEDDYTKIGFAYRTDSTDLSDELYRVQANKYATSSIATSSIFVKLERQTALDYDGDSDHRDTSTEYTYDNTKGTVSTKIDWGRVAASLDGTFSDMTGDKRTHTYSYASSSVNNILAILARETVKNESNATSSDTRFYFDSQSFGAANDGNLTKREHWVATSSYIDYEWTYNGYGLPTQEKDPRDKTTLYSYDSYNLYPATTTNPLSQATKYTYDYSSGKPKTVADANNLTQTYVYDGLDRLIEEKVPDPLTGSSVTKTLYTFTDAVGSSSVRTQSYRTGSSSSDIYSYLDGFGREIQSRTSAETSNQYVLKDSVFGDNGLLHKETLPYFGNGSARSTATTTADLFSEYSYDAMARIASTTNTVGTTHIGRDQWKETVTDVLGNEKASTYDAYGRLAEVIENNATSSYETAYEWDHNNNLIKITDALGNVRNITYDGLSRRLTLEDLHDVADVTFGTWSFGYDATGNLTTKTDPKSQTINYTYDDLNRPLTEDYTGTGGTEVAYAYDSCTRGVGRLCTAGNASATTTHTYNYAGIPATEARTVGTTTYTTEYEYDRLGNQTLVIYPDDSEVRYTYNIANLPETVEQRENGGSWQDVIEDFDYGPHGLVTYQSHGNGTLTTKTYDPAELYRLRTLVTTATSTYGGGGAGPEHAQAEAELASLELLEEVTTPATGEEVMAEESISVPEGMNLAVSEVVGTSTDADSTTQESELDTVATTSAETLEATLTEPIESETATTTATSTIEFGLSSTTPEALLPVDTVLETAVTTVDIATTTLEILEVKPVDTSVTDHLITSTHEANIWQKFHTERVAALEKEIGLLPEALESARYAKDKFDNYLLQKGYVTEKGGPVKGQAQDAIENKLKKVFEAIISAVLPETAYAYLFGVEDFEDCGSLPCSFSNTSAWGSVTQSLDSTSKVEGADSLKELVTGEGGATLESINHNEDEVWVQFKVFIPSSMTWGGSGYFTILRFEDSSNGGIFWMSVENWGTPRLTVAGDTLSWTNTGIDLVPGEVNTLEVRFKKSATAGDVDIWHNTTTEGSPDYNGSGTLNTGTDNVDDILVGMAYAPENGIATTYYDEIAIDTAFIGELTEAPIEPFAEYLQHLTYAYDLAGNISSIVDASDTQSAATTTYAYDDLYRLTTASTTAASSTPYSQTYSYNAIGNLLTKSDVGAYSYQGDQGNEVTYGIYTDSITSGWSDWSWSTTLNPSNTSPVYAGSYSLRAIYGSAWAGMSYHSNSFDSSPYDELHLSVNVGTSTSVNLYAYFTNASGTALEVVDLEDYVTGDFVANTWHEIEIPLTDLDFENYNAATNFTIEASATGTVYYDEIKLVGDDGGTPSYANPHAATAINGVSYSYDHNGNLASTTAGITNIWNYDNRLTTSYGGGTTTYAYDPGGQRVSKTSGGLTTVYPSNLYEELGTTTVKHIYANGQLVATVEEDTPGPKTYHNHLDHLGSTNAVSTDIGYLNQELAYYPFGSMRIDEQHGELLQTRQYLSQISDSETLHSYMNARYLNNINGQFVSQDPVFWEIGLTQDGRTVLTSPQMQNAYSYVENNPVSKKDASGRQSINVSGGYTVSVPGTPMSTGPMGGLIFALDGVYSYQGVSVSVRPGPSASLNISPSNPSGGYNSGFSAYGAYGIFGGQVGAQQSATGNLFSGEFGIGLPGASWDTYKVERLFGYVELIDRLAGPMQYETTPAFLNSNNQSTRLNPNGLTYSAPRATNNAPSVHNQSWLKAQISLVNEQINRVKEMISIVQGQR